MNAVSTSSTMRRGPRWPPAPPPAPAAGVASLRHPSGPGLHRRVFHGLEIRDLLRPAVLADCEVIREQAGDRPAATVHDRDVEADQAGVRAQLRGLALLGRSEREG